MRTNRTERGRALREANKARESEMIANALNGILTPRQMRDYTKGEPPLRERKICDPRNE